PGGARAQPVALEQHDVAETAVCQVPGYAGADHPAADDDDAPCHARPPGGRFYRVGVRGGHPLDPKERCATPVSIVRRRIRVVSLSPTKLSHQEKRVAMGTSVNGSAGPNLGRDPERRRATARCHRWIKMMCWSSSRVPGSDAAAAAALN